MQTIVFGVKCHFSDTYTMTHLARPAADFVLRALLCAMFFVFAMTTDAVGSIIPLVIDEFHLSLSQASAFQYATMGAIALGAIACGSLAEKLGRKATIIIGLCAYAAACLAFLGGDTFVIFTALLALGGVGIAVFKVGALALLGDISPTQSRHTSTMNLIEGFFAVGAIVGPALVAALIAAGMHWKYLYAIAAAICTLLVIIAAATPFPRQLDARREKASIRRTLTLARDPHALGFAVLIMLYVGIETAIYVWMPTFLKLGASSVMSAWALTVFFIFRAIGRFFGAWLLSQLSWQATLGVFGLAILACFGGSLLGGPAYAAYLLPISGLFMSVMYPSLNSKGISGFARHDHAAVAGLILFFTAIAAAAAPLAMGAVGDAFGGVEAGFGLATAWAALLAAALIYNWVRDPAGGRLARLETERTATAG
jgi:fucose permease